MGRERKAQSGATNLSTRSTPRFVMGGDPTESGDGMVALDRTMSLTTDAQSRKSTKTLTSKTKKRSKGFYKRPDYRNFDTTHSSEFPNPAEVPQNPLEVARLAAIPTTESVQKAREAHAKRVAAIEKFCEFANAQYGTVGSMLRAFRKRHEDDISLYEISEYLRRHKSENHLNEQEKQAIFTHISPNHNGNVPVSSFLKCVEAVEFRDKEPSQDLAHVRNYLKDELQSTRTLTATTMAALSPEQMEFTILQEKHAVPNTKERIAEAIGMRTFDLKVTPEELDAINAKNSETLPSTEAERGYARYLIQTNTPLAAIPFYKMKTDDLHNSTFRAALNEKQSSPLRRRLEELERARWVGSLATREGVAEAASVNLNVDELLPKLSTTKSLPALQKAVRASPLVTMGPEATSELLSHSMRTVVGDSERRAAELKEFVDSTSAEPVPIYRNERRPATSNQSLQRAKSTGGLGLRSSVPNLATSSRGRGHDIDDIIIISLSPPRSSGSQLEPLISPNELAARTAMMNRTMATERALMNAFCSSVKIGGPEIFPVDSYKTVSHSVHSDLDYVPSQIPTRVSESESTVNYRKKERIRAERRARSEANQMVTAIRLDHTAVENELRQLNRSSSRLKDQINYKTNVFIDDLHHFKSFAAVRVSKKQNVGFANKMRNGTGDWGVSSLIDDSRDFSSTHTASFTSLPRPEV